MFRKINSTRVKELVIKHKKARILERDSNKQEGLSKFA